MTLRIDQLSIEWLEDGEWDDSADASGNYRLLGCRAVAEVSYSTADPVLINTAGSRRLEWLKSGGLWGIDTPSPEYQAEVEQNELLDLRVHLTHFDINPTDDEWDTLVGQLRRSTR